MAGIQIFEFDPARLEGSFSDMQPVSDAVQRAESTTPGCCGRTRVTISCRSFERGYSLDLPLHGRKPNESPFEPPQNFQSVVMAAEIPPPMLQLLSRHDGDGVAEVLITASGPAECPPGTPSRLVLEGSGGCTRDVPQKAWTWSAPAILDAAQIESLDENLISLLHPFKMPHLPAQLWKLSLPRCPASQIKATIATFPDVRWRGELNVTTRPNPEVNSGYEMRFEGDLACSYNDKRWLLQDKSQAKALSKWIDGLDVLARSAAAFTALRPASRHAGLDNPRLTRMEEFRFEPWPRLSIALEAQLFEQEGNGLLGHALSMRVQAAPLIGASGEMSLLGPWLEQMDKKPIIRPLLAALDVIRAEEIAQELGLWLVADGQISLRAGVEAKRPQLRTTTMGRANGSVRLGLEARSIRDYDSFVIHQGGSADTTIQPGFHATCKAAPEAPFNDPREHPPMAAFEFSGLSISRLEKRRPGCVFRHHSKVLPGGEGAEKSPEGCMLAPARSWPADATLEAPAEVPWCD